MVTTPVLPETHVPGLQGLRGLSYEPRRAALSLGLVPALLGRETWLATLCKMPPGPSILMPSAPESPPERTRGSVLNQKLGAHFPFLPMPPYWF